MFPRRRNRDQLEEAPPAVTPDALDAPPAPEPAAAGQGAAALEERVRVAVMHAFPRLPRTDSFYRSCAQVAAELRD